MNSDVERVESLLRAARPAPSASFVHELECWLIDRPATPHHHRLRLLIAAWGFAAALAFVGVGLASAGLLPFASSAGRADAGAGCGIVTVQRTALRPQFVVDRQGPVRVHYRRAVISEPAERCR